jgi:glycosyltransferase involved in cell wall biosynthesis
MIGACGAYRTAFVGYALRERGHDVAFVANAWEPYLHEDRTAHYRVSKDIRYADLVVFQRLSNAPNLGALMRSKEFAKVIHEVDDNMHDLPASNLAHGLYGDNADGTHLVEAACRMADGVTTATPTLATRYSEYNANVVCLPNAIPDDAYERVRDREIVTGWRRRDHLRIGWSGAGDFHQADLAIIRKPLMTILTEYPFVRLVFFGGKTYPRFPGFEDRIEHYPNLPATKGVDYADGEAVAKDVTDTIYRFYNVLSTLDFDIGLAPIQEHTFNDCKSDLKILEHGFLGIPMVCSDFGPYARYAQQDGGYVALAKTDQDWELRLCELIEQPELRAIMANQNREHIAKNHLMSKKIEAREAFYEGLL